MLPTMSVSSLPKSLTLSSSFLNGSQLCNLAEPKPSQSSRSSVSLSPILAMKTMQGKVVCSTNNKTVSVEVTRLAPHPKYMRRVRIKKKYQAHDPDNQFKVGDIVQLEKCRPISKTKSFLAVPVAVRSRGEKKEGAGNEGDIGIPFESQVVESS